MSGKKIIILTILILSIVLALIFVFRPDNISVNKSEEKKTALTTFTVIADMASEVAGDKVDIVSLTKPGVEIHGYEPTPGDLIRASKADIIFDNGLNLEMWAHKLYSSIPNVPHVTLSEGVEIVPIAEGAYKDKPNPHAWMSPKQALIYVENIRKGLISVAPEHEEYFNNNAKIYSQKILELDKHLSESLNSISPNQRYLVTCEGAFGYLVKDYGMKELYLWAINDESQGSPQQIAAVVDSVKKYKIPVIFCESTIDPRIQEEVVRESGSRLGGLLYVDSLSDEKGPAPTYLKLLEHTVITIVNGLQNSKN